ncbi:AraC family transcriptional regulator [Amycolatopsis samaneae]|uniref:AraC family transcriptional regulator n=1 Tax=Amycolatopsis samaneae TaxID=664691 RepID=A0ABW5GVD2_9PSEU
MAGHTVAIHFVRSAVRAVEKQGLDVRPALAKAGIARSLIDYDRARITVEQASAMVRGLWRLTGDEMFGLSPCPMPLGTFRMMALGMIHQPDLGAVLDRCCEFSRIVPGMPDLRTRLGPGTCRIEADVESYRWETIIIDTILFMLHRFAGWLANTRVRLRLVELPQPEPSYLQDYDLVYGAPVRFAAGGAAITIDREVLPAPVVRDEDDLLRFLGAAPADILARREYDSSVVDQVRRILSFGLRGHAPSAVTSREVAARLSLSLQHVRRLLREEGTSISRIREEVLRDAAIASLVRGEEPIAVLSERLGFSEPSAFRRAFRRWTGSPPGSYRPGGTEGGSAGKSQQRAEPGEVDPGGVEQAG